MPERSGTWERVIASCWCLLLVVVSRGAFRVDEPNIIAIAKQIARSPLDPYGFVINWTGTPRPAFEILANPPLVPAWLAAWASLFGWSEIALHLSVIPFSALALWSASRLARHFAAEGRLVVALMLASPAFVLGSAVVMPDVPMLSFFLCSLALLFDHLERPSPVRLACASACAALTPMLKYNGLILLPLLVIVAILRPRSWRAVAMPVIASFATLVGWEIFTRATYGQSHIFAISEFEGSFNATLLTGALSAIGLGVLPLALLRLESRTTLRRPIEAFVLLTAFAGAALIAYGQFRYLLLPSLLFGLAIAAAARLLLIVALRISAAAKPLDWRPWFLGAWIGGTIAFQFKLIFSSVRYMLPMLVPAILVMAAAVTVRSKYLRPLLAANIVFALAILIGDLSVADTYRSFSTTTGTAVKTSAQRIYFDGHWGFQYYMEALGGVIIDGKQEPAYRAGDALIVARNPFPSIQGPTVAAGLTYEHRQVWLNPSWPLRTIECRGAANFYGNGIGPCVFWGTAYLPFSVSTRPSERFDIYLIRNSRPGEAAPAAAWYEPETSRGAFR